MSKEILATACSSDNADNFVWSMYFYKIDRRAKGHPYKFYKVSNQHFRLPIFQNIFPVFQGFATALVCFYSLCNI